MRGPTTRGRGCSCRLGPARVLGAAPQWPWAAPRGPGWVRAQLRVQPPQAAGWALEKAACSRAEHREPERGRESSRPLLGGAPELEDRRGQGKAVLASKGHSRALCLRVREHREDQTGHQPPWAVIVTSTGHRVEPQASPGDELASGAPLRASVLLTRGPGSGNRLTQRIGQQGGRAPPASLSSPSTGM